MFNGQRKSREHKSNFLLTYIRVKLLSWAPVFNTDSDRCYRNSLLTATSQLRVYRWSRSKKFAACRSAGPIYYKNNNYMRLRLLWRKCQCNLTQIGSIYTIQSVRKWDSRVYADRNLCLQNSPYWNRVTSTKIITRTILFITPLRHPVQSYCILGMIDFILITKTLSDNILFYTSTNFSFRLWVSPNTWVSKRKRKINGSVK